jgi:hypothetical protein
VGKKILGFMFAMPLLGAALPAAAQDWRDERRYDDRYYRDGRRGGGAFDEGYSRGYDDGAKEGSKDGRRGTRFELQREGRYRDGDSGYRDRYGSRSSYVSGYRRGYEEGYRRGYYTRSRDRYSYERDYRYPRY